MGYRATLTGKSGYKSLLTAITVLRVVRGIYSYPSYHGEGNWQLNVSHIPDKDIEQMNGLPGLMVEID